MQQTSQLYKDLLADPNHTVEVKLVIDDVEYEQSEIFSLSTISKVFDDTPTIGGTYSGTLDFSILIQR